MVSKNSFKLKGGAAGAASPAYKTKDKFFFVRGHSLIEQTSNTTLKYKSIRDKFLKEVNIDPINVQIYHLVSEGLCAYETIDYYKALGAYSKLPNKLGAEAMTILQSLRVEATPHKGKNNLTGISGWIDPGDTVDQDLHFYNSPGQDSNLGVWDLNTLTAIDKFNPLQTEKGQTYNLPNICFLQQFSLVDMEEGKILKLSQIIYILMDMYPDSNIHIIHGSCRGATDGTQNTQLLTDMREEMEAKRKACPIPDQVAPEKIKFSEYIKHLESVLLTPIVTPATNVWTPATNVWTHGNTKLVPMSIVSNNTQSVVPMSIASMPRSMSLASMPRSMSLASLASMPTRSSNRTRSMSVASMRSNSTTSTMSDDTVKQEPTQEYQNVFKGGGKSKKKRRYSKRRRKKSKRKKTLKRKSSKKKKRNSRKKYKN